MDRDVIHKIFYGLKRGDIPVHKLPFGTKCHVLFVITYIIFNTCTSVKRGVFVIEYLRPKKKFGQNSEETLY